MGRCKLGGFLKFKGCDRVVTFLGTLGILLFNTGVKNRFLEFFCLTYFRTFNVQSNKKGPTKLRDILNPVQPYNTA